MCLYVKKLGEIFSVFPKIESIIFKCIPRQKPRGIAEKNEKHDIFNIRKTISNIFQ